MLKTSHKPEEPQNISSSLSQQKLLSNRHYESENA